MEDQKAIELYTRFREARRSLEHKYQLAVYHTLFDRVTYPGIALPFIEIAKEQTQEIANTVNEFAHCLHDLRAWELREGIQGVFYLSPIVIVGRGELQNSSLPVDRRSFSDIWTRINFILASKLISLRAYVY